jgi:hypothetical protein
MSQNLIRIYGADCMVGDDRKLVEIWHLYDDGSRCHERNIKTVELSLLPKCPKWLKRIFSNGDDTRSKS